MGRVRLAVAGITAGVVVALGCDALTGLDSLQEVACVDASCASSDAGAPDGPSTDTTSSDVLRADAPRSDGSVLDATVDADAGGGDAAIDVVADAPTLKWCATHPHAFCADFDEGSVSAGWSTIEVSDAGSISLDNLAFTSPPDSMLSIMSASNAGGTSARLYETFDTTFPKIVFAYDVRVDLLSASDVGLLSSVYFGEYHEHIRLVGGRTLLVEFFNPNDGGASSDLASYTASTGIATGIWTHVEVDFFLTAGLAPTANVLLNGTTVIQNAALSNAVPMQPPAFHIGLYFLASNGAWRAHFDDVTVDFPP